MAPAAVVTAKTVVVADDTAFVRDRFRTALEAAGHRAITVANRRDLLAAIRREGQAIDLIVLDLRLPQSQGLQLVREMRKIDPQGAPVVVFSGTIATAAEVRELSALGVAGYINEYSSVQHIVPSLAPHLFPQHHNRRSSPRVTLGIAIAYRFGNTIATALTLNISHGGVAVRTTNPLAEGAIVRLRFRLPGSKEVEAGARVAWTDRRVGMGLQFTSVDAAAQLAIDDYVQGHFFSNRKA